MTEFDDLIDRDGLDVAEEARLRRVHDLLVQAGPPPELPPAHSTPAAPSGSATRTRSATCRWS